MPNWTTGQKNAIEARNGTILVSAAAGSGKTAVLVERVIQRLMDEENPCDADKLLIVTFTRAATQQMKERIFKAITEKLREFPDNEHLKHQLILLPFAHISTIDSFCNDIVKENFHELNIAPDCKLLEGAELKIMEADAVEKTLEELYKENSESFKALTDLLVNGADDSALSDLIRNIYKNSRAFSRPEVWVENLISDYNDNAKLADSRWGKLIIKRVLDSIIYCRIISEKMSSCLIKDKVANEKYATNISEINNTLTDLINIIENGTWDEIRSRFKSVNFSALGRLPKGYESPYTDFIKEQKKAISDIIKKDTELFCASEQENKYDIAILKPLVEKLIFAVKRYGEIFTQIKLDSNGIDFSDITHLALRLLVEFDKDGITHRTKLAETVSEKFDEILVDEFQDINEIQSTLFNAVSKDESNLFMVGDVKQSIYRFRQAMPEIFLSRRDAMEYYDGSNYPARIDLDRNFRSRFGVTENINFIFKQIMSKEVGSINYSGGETLICAADYPPCDFPEFELEVVEQLDDGTRATRQTEAERVAEKIEEIVSEKMQIKSGDTTRNIEYKDFCILLRSVSGGKADIYAKALADRNIPSYVTDKTGFFEAVEISTMLNLMRVIDNPVQDIPLLAVMFSPAFGFTPDNLAKMRTEQRKMPLYHCIVSYAVGGDKKTAEFLEKIENLRMLSSTLPCAEFVRELYEETGYYAIVSAMKNGAKRRANLNMLIEYASKYESSGHRGLSGFIRFIDRVQRQNSDLESASDVSETANVVRIMTIHKSKGLEFPVCIVADTNAQFIVDGKRGAVAFHPYYGICFDIKDNDTKCKYATVGKKAITQAENDSTLSEEMRVLYVALTRAKERLICFSRADNIEKKLSSISAGLTGTDSINPYIIKNCASMAYWLWAAYLRHPYATALRRRLSFNEENNIKTSSQMKITFTDNLKGKNDVGQDDEICEIDDELLSEISKRLDYVYPYASLSNVRAKSAPSEFDSQIFTTENFASAKPQFLSKSGMNPASRGTATHKFMEFFDYSADCYNVKEQIDRMVSENRLTYQEAMALEVKKLEKYFDGDIAKRIKASPLLMREEKVTIGVPVSELYPEMGEDYMDETVVIQGYVDCAFEENGKLVIVDYKTDRGVTMQDLRNRYSTQLKMYERALHECTGKDISSTLIYSFDNEDYIEL